MIKLDLKIDGNVLTRKQLNFVKTMARMENNRMRHVWNAGLNKFTTLVKDNIKKQGGVFGRRWAKIGVWAKVLRKTSTRKYRTISGIANHAVKTLWDTGEMLMSLYRIGTKGHMHSVTNRGAKMGSANERAMFHNAESDSTRTKPFKFGPEEEALLKQNMSSSVNGQSNREFYALRNSMRSAVGSSFTTPRRKLFPDSWDDIAPSDRKSIIKAIDDKFADELKDEGINV